MQETQETWVWSLGQEDPLQEEMATHSSITASRTPWTEVRGRLELWGLKELDTTENACMPWILKKDWVQPLLFLIT